MKRNNRTKYLIGICVFILIAGIVVTFSIILSQRFAGGDSKSSELRNSPTEQSTEQYASVNNTSLDSKTEVGIKNFSIKLFQKVQKKNENTLVSPVSVLYALAVVANGADGNTKEEFQKAVGLDVNEWNTFLSEYQKDQPTKAKHQLKIANSIWVNDNASFQLNSNFKKTIKENFQSEVYTRPFDKKTIHKINDWVDTNTNHLIPSIVKELNKEDVMCAINAVAFEAQWEHVYTKDQVSKSTFTKEDNTTQQIEMMYQKEANYIKGANETGFIKYYANRSYAFVALMPNEGIKLEDYINQLNGNELNSLLTQAKETSVDTGIPKFKTTSEIQLVDALKEMGIKDAFDAKKADFSKMGQTKKNRLFIGKVIHKTHIVVDEKGTKAGAATAVIMEGSTFQENPQVYLNRPFLYFIIDCKTNTLIFMGSIYDVK